MNPSLLKLKELMLQKKVDALLISSTPNITYFTNYSGFSIIEREAYLLITRNQQYLLTDGRYTEAVRDISNFTLLEISPINPLKKILTDLIEKHKIKKLGIEENNLTVSEYKILKKHFGILTNCNELYTIRLIKNKNEVTAIEKACALGDETFKHVIKKIKEGITEQEIAFEIEFFVKKAGADISFKPIVAFDKNAAVPHHQTSNQKLTTNNWVLLDFGTKVNNYCSDMTRTVFFGKASSKQKHMYQTVLDAQTKAIGYLKSLILNYKSINAGAVDKVARDHIISQAYPTIPHSLGHGIGLEVHEAPHLSPNSKDILKTGMVFSVEPGIYLPNVGGVRIEDLVVFEKSGPRLLTNALKNLLEL